MYAKPGSRRRVVTPPEDAHMRSVRDEAGGIEGMPLQLMILVIVTGLVLAVVLGNLLLAAFGLGR